MTVLLMNPLDSLFSDELLIIPTRWMIFRRVVDESGKLFDYSGEMDLDVGFG